MDLFFKTCWQKLMMRISLLSLLLVVVQLFSSAIVLAEEKMGASEALERAMSLKLFEEPYWLALLHYKAKSFGRDGLISDVQTERFFLSPDGRTNPKSEMVATIEAIFAISDPLDLDAHGQCRFVARYKWLKKQLDRSAEAIQQVPCPGFRLWSLDGKVESISFIFATGYLDNPASFFGHPLLRFNRAQKRQGDELFDTSLNYGAITPGDDNALVYALKGLLGGYDAGFTSFNFFYHHHNYGENELRDLWVYQLDLSPEQVDQIVSSTWELLGNKFPYFFLHDNCAYRMSELLEFVIGKPLLPRGVPYSIPYTVYDRLSSIKKDDGKPLVKSVTRIPSRQSRLYEKYSSLGDDQKTLVKSVATQEYGFENTTYQALPLADRITVVETLFDYNAFRMSTEGDNEAFRADRTLLLLERLKLPAGHSHVSYVSDAKPPHEGQRPVMTRVGAIYNSEFGAGVEIRLRPAYYDMISPEVGRLPNSSLNVFDLKIAAFEDGAILRALDIINIETLNMARTDLPGDGGFAWKFKLGLESQDLSCTGCSVFGLDAGVGLAHQFMPSLISYAMFEGRLQTPQHESGSLAATPRLGLLSTFGDNWKTLAVIGFRSYLDGRQAEEPVIKLESRFGSSRTWDIRASYEEHVARQYSVSYSYYW